MSFLHCICDLVPGLHFCVKIFRFMLYVFINFFLTNEKKYIYRFLRISHSFSIGVIFFYIPSEQPNQALFYIYEYR